MYLRFQGLCKAQEIICTYKLHDTCYLHSSKHYISNPSKFILKRILLDSVNSKQTVGSKLYFDFEKFLNADENIPCVTVYFKLAVE